uniref:Sperm-activating peptide (Glu-3,Met-4, Gly-5, Thr-7 SAP-I) n=1 Tax=Heterocentrotus mammillatus TaxID=31180 RepID=Q7M4C0_HETMA|nr:sperm-activating peptide I (3-Glu,4-Met,5-Gly,7-Thr) [Heterocentrotus mammillatus]
GFEMGGTGVG